MESAGCFFRNVGAAFSLRRCRLSQAKNACVPHTPYTLILEFVPPAGRVCGAATHAVGGDVGYGVLKQWFERQKTRAVGHAGYSLLILSLNTVQEGCVVQPRKQLSGGAGYGLLSIFS